MRAPKLHSFSWWWCSGWLWKVQWFTSFCTSHILPNERFVCLNVNILEQFNIQLATSGIWSDLKIERSWKVCWSNNLLNWTISGSENSCADTQDLKRWREWHFWQNILAIFIAIEAPDPDFLVRTFSFWFGACIQGKNKISLAINLLLSSTIHRWLVQLLCTWLFWRNLKWMREAISILHWRMKPSHKLPKNMNKFWIETWNIV